MRALVLAVSVFIMLAVAGVTLSACGDDTKSNGESGQTERGPADVLAFPRGFRNVAHKCDGPNMVYSASRGDADEGRGGAIAVVAGDPRCR